MATSKLPLPNMLFRSHMVITPGWEDLLRRHRLDQVPGVYELRSGHVLSQTGSKEVRQVELGCGPDTRSVFIKKYWVSGKAQLWKGMFRGTLFGSSKVRREYANLRRLRAWNLQAPEPVAYGEQRRGGWLVRSFLISEAVPEAVPLHTFIRDRLADLPPAEARCRRRELLLNLADSTRLLHEHRFVHFDYFWRNILLSGGSLRAFFLIDAHKGRKWYPGEESRARAQDLATLDAAAPSFFRRTERLLFFLRYCGQTRLDQHTKTLLRRTLRVAAPLREKQLYRVLGRPVAVA